MKFSVLMSVYMKDDPELFITAVKSISLEQNVEPDEVILVIDGPIRGSLLEAVKNIKSKISYLVTVPLDENVGLGNALNIGLDNCKNDIVFRMDSDDCSLSTRFESQLRIFESDPKVDAVGGYIEEICPKTLTCYGKRTVPLSCQEIIEFSKYRNPINHVTIGFRKSAVLKAGGYQHLLFFEDYYLWLRMLSVQCKIVNIPEVLVKVSSGNSMLGRRKGLVYIKSEFELFKIKALLNTSPTPTNVLIFLLRVIPRFLPTTILGVCYKFLRTKERV
jgi:glycosyltransferase involved in cell wall biosynthesis